MKLREALETIQEPSPAGAARVRYFLGCSSTPTHLATFLHAHLCKRLPLAEIILDAPTYGDLLGSLERLKAEGYSGVVVLCEWFDLDPRLGFRRLGGWAPSLFSDILDTVRLGFLRLQVAVERISAVSPVAIALPTLPLPPLEISIPAQSVGLESELWRLAWDFFGWCSSRSGIRKLSMAELDRRSASSERFDLRGELASGCPYRVPYASILASLMSELLAPEPPLKGLITDLDDTLWAGILGEVGAGAIGFTLDQHGQSHGLYQQFLESLAERGVLLAIASKNDAALAEEALARTDLLIRRHSFFPAEIHWRSKSESVRRILEAWNIGPEAVAFVDDSPLEIEEVKSNFPEIRTLPFPKGDPGCLLDFFHTLRQWFGKPGIREEDAIRVESLKNRSSVKSELADSGSQDAFLTELEARISFQLSRDHEDARALELVNKTNQFNLNGRRMSEASWRESLSDPDAFLVTVSYRDKFGPLGKIAVVRGRKVRNLVEVSTWVMSCRAFSRRIEHATLQYLFESMEVDHISLEFEHTERNTPLANFLAELKIPEDAAVVSRAQFDALCPQLAHLLEEVTAHA